MVFHLIIQIFFLRAHIIFISLDSYFTHITQKNKYTEFLKEELANTGRADHLNQSSDSDYPDSIPRKKRKLILSKGAAINKCSNSKQFSSAKILVNKQPRKTEKDIPHLIKLVQCASRSALLSSLIVASSPILKPSKVNHLNTNSCSILAIGGKSGNISFWKIYEPKCYTIEHGRVHVDPVLIGVIEAHNTWITAISWEIYSGSFSSSKLVLATGSCDGSVKLWLGDVEGLIKSSETNSAPFFLFREVTAVTSVPVSTVSLMAPLVSTDMVILAIGRGSGSLEVSSCQLSRDKIENKGVYSAHKQVVTGLTWTYDGCQLYSCSQDNSVRSWVLRDGSLCETSFPLNFPGTKNSTDLSAVSDLCFGLALSPGGLVAAVVRSFDSDVLNQMYEARIQKAAVEFYWTGAHSQEIPSDEHLIRWQSTILWSLKHFEYGDEPLVLWDNLMALLTFLKSMPTFVEHIIYKWISSWFVDCQIGDSLERILLYVQSMIPKLSTHKIHLLNIICRRLMLGEAHDLSEGEGGDVETQLWKKLLVNCERELQERYVAFTFNAVLARSTSVSEVENWSPIGVAQMERWVDIFKHDLVHDKLKQLGSKVGTLRNRIHSICEYKEEESCSYCSASVPFESVSVARCEGINHENGSNHELIRCAVSMKLGSTTSPMWFCTCCKRQVLNLPPSLFFTMPESPLDVNLDDEFFASQECSKPLCIFCGILLQRILPDFLLSAAPV